MLPRFLRPAMLAAHQPPIGRACEGQEVTSVPLIIHLTGRSNMNLERIITTSESESVIRDSIASYLGKLGYKQVDSQPRLIYERGSALGSFTSFSPKGWQVRANVEISTNSDQMTVASVNLDINTKGQWVTEKERIFWNNELDGLETAICTGKADVTSTSKAAQSSLVQNLIAAAVILGLTIVLFVIARQWLKF